jgi:hydroxymethylpyrimidine/phosphomethylpyrimidine kinase
LRIEREVAGLDVAFGNACARSAAITAFIFCALAASAAAALRPRVVTPAVKRAISGTRVE